MTTSITSGDIFRKVIPHKNFMTPDVVEYITVRDYEAELSQGNGIGGTPMFGVTVVNRVTWEREIELDRVFESIKTARLYVSELGRDWR